MVLVLLLNTEHLMFSSIFKKSPKKTTVWPKYRLCVESLS